MMTDRKMVTDFDKWPCWPYLPVVRRSAGLPEGGVLWEGTGGLTVHCANLFRLPPDVEAFKALPCTKYESADALIADGWEVD